MNCLVFDLFQYVINKYKCEQRAKVRCFASVIFQPVQQLVSLFVVDPPIIKNCGCERFKLVDLVLCWRAALPLKANKYFCANPCVCGGVVMFEARQVEVLCKCFHLVVLEIR